MARERKAMKISDELRALCDETNPWPTRADVRAIADRIRKLAKKEGE